MRVKPSFKSLLGLLLGLFLLGEDTHAQWLTQTFTLTNGWNAIYSHVDASHTTLDQQITTDGSNPILEVWRWNPSASIQFITSVQERLDMGSQWITWSRTNSNSSLQRLVGNSAYLVRISTNSSSYTWGVKGKPLAPPNDWTTTGLNFFGFSTPTNSTPSFETFLAQAPLLRDSAEIYYYRGGELDSNNPTAMLSPRTTIVNRGQAFWMRAGAAVNRYFGPFEIQLGDASAIEFRTNLSTAPLLLRNLTTNQLTVTGKLIGGETPPEGQPAIAGVPPLMLRGALNPATLTYAYTTLSIGDSYTWTLQPQGQLGSEIEVVVGLNRSAITNAGGTFLAGVIRLTDSLGYLQVDTAVSAVAAHTSGLWVGGAKVSGVGQYLKTYVLDTNGNPLVSSNGSYVIKSIETRMAPTPRPFPLRLIIHNPDATNASLLQRVFIGLDHNTNMAIANKESALNPARIRDARRISATHLPFSADNAPWAFDGSLGSASFTATVTLDYADQSSNPFLHTYHPDHDNLDETFDRSLVQGAESYSVTRQMTLTPAAPANDFNGLVDASETIGGDYRETISVLGLSRAGGASDTRSFFVQGKFTLKRISEVPTLTLVP